MTAIPSGFLADSLRPDPVIAPVRRSPRWLAAGRRLLEKTDPVTFSRYLAAFFVGVAATVSWQSYLGGSSPAVAAGQQPEQVNAILLDTVRRSIDKLAAGQEQIAHEIDKMQAAQFVLYRHSEPPRSATGASATNANPPTEADARAAWRRQPCCQWPATGGAW